MSREEFAWLVIAMDTEEVWCEGEGWKKLDANQIVSLYKTEKEAEKVAWTLGYVDPAGARRTGIVYCEVISQ